MAGVLLVFGGRSAEHEVSCVSAVAIREALAAKGHKVVLVGIDRDGGWHLAAPDANPLEAVGPPVTFSVPAGSLFAGDDRLSVEVAFPVLHGPWGEDGTIQGLFEIAGLPYVGAGVLGSALGMDKDVAKRLLADAGLAIARYLVVRSADWDESPGRTVDRVVSGLGLPVFVKPAAMGSSIGVAKAADEAGVKQAIEGALAFGPKVVIEEAVTAREIEVAVLEGPRVSVPGEVITKSDWYDYDAKYVDETSRFVAPAELTAAETERVRALAGRAFQVLEGRGLARVDFLFEQGGRGFLVNEINTMPGFTPISGFPKMWLASGMTYPELCDELVRLALA